MVSCGLAAWQTPEEENGDIVRQYSLWVVEDDAAQRDEIARLITALPDAASYDIVLLEGPCELKERIAHEGAPDIALLDIDLGEESPTGVDLAEAFFSSKRTQIIYTTAYLNCVTDVYRTNHVYTLAKPVKSEQLELALGKALRVLDALEHESLAFAFGTGVKKVLCADIMWLESAGHRVEIHMVDGVRVTYESLRSLMGKLPLTFMRSHKSYVVNFACISELTERELIMSDGSRVPVSRKYRHALKEALEEYLGQKAGKA